MPDQLERLRYLRSMAVKVAGSGRWDVLAWVPAAVATVMAVTAALVAAVLAWRVV